MRRSPTLHALLFAGLAILAGPSPAADLVDQLRLSSHDSATRSEHLTVVSVEGQSFERAVQVSVQARPRESWNVILRLPTAAPIAAGEQVRISFTIRGWSDDGDARTRAFFQKAGPPHTKSFAREIDLTDQWQRVEAMVTSAGSYGPGEAEFGLHLGFAKQTVQVADLEIRRMSNGPAIMPVRPPQTPSEPGSLLPADTLAQMRVKNSTSNGNAIRAERVNVDHPAFDEAIELHVESGVPKYWQLEWSGPTVAPVEAGDIASLVFYVRSLSSDFETGEGRVACFFQQAGPPHTKSLAFQVSVGRDWMRVEQPFRVRQGYPAGGAEIGFHVGHNRQVLQIGGIEAKVHPDGTRMSDLPIFPRITYPGREPDAPWRAEAAERIDRLRKADMTVRVVDAQDQPVSGANVHVQMTRHAFPFGVEIGSHILDRDQPHNQQYRKLLLENFNEAVPGSGLKTELWNRENFRPRTLLAVDWLDEHGFTQRGHWLSHGVFELMAGGVEASQAHTMRENPETLRAFIYEQMREKLEAVGDTITEWDAINHLTGYWGTSLDAIDGGLEIYADIMRKARDLAPNATLYVNESGILASGREAHAAEYRRRIEYLIDAGAGPDGIGMMAHFGWNSLTPPTELLARLDDWATLGLPIKATEFDISVSDPGLHADYLRDFLTILFSHAAVEGVVQWGFWEGAHWMPEAALWRKDFSIKPAGEAYRELIFDQWWTDATLTTDDSGEAAVRGFRGAYRVTASHGGKSAEATVPLDADGQTITLRLP